MTDHFRDTVHVNRRRLLQGSATFAAFGAALSSEVANAAASSSAPVPTLVPVFTALVKLLPPIEYGVTAGVKKRLIPIAGGTFNGERIKGTVLPGGGDWQDVATDGSASIFARYSLRTHDGTIVGVINPGIRNGPPDVLMRLALGEPVDPSSYYFRTTPTFAVEDGPYEWLRKSLFICSGVRRSESVEIVCYSVT